MNTAASQLELTAGDGADSPSLSWDLDQIGPGPEDKFILFDKDDTPRLILTAAELAEMQQQKTAEVSQR